MKASLKSFSVPLAALSFFALYQPQTATATSLLFSWGPVNYTQGSDTASFQGTASFTTQFVGAGNYNLVIVLSNTSTDVPPGTAWLLDGLYFNITGAPAGLQMLSAVATLGTLVDGHTPSNAGADMCTLHGSQSAPDPACSAYVDGGWQAAFNASGIGGGASATQHYGIGTTGQGGVFQGSDVGTFEYSITPGGTVGIDVSSGHDGITSAYNNAISHNHPPPLYAYGTATFTLGGLTTDAITVTNVAGAYGTAPEGTPAGTDITNGPPPPGVPEPGTWMMLSGGLGLAGMLRFRHKKA